jgi:Uma2 family endonuclease
MAAAQPIPFISVEEYLREDYEPDCDYVDGVLEERHWGERDHGEMEGALYTYFRGKGRRPNVRPFLEQRVQVKPTRYRVPDVCLMVGPKPTEQIFKTAPAIVIEVLSPEDRLPRMQRRVDDFLNFGVKQVWLIDPADRRCWIWDRAGMREVAEGVFRFVDDAAALDVTLPMAEIYAAIDSDE